jgi:hypothetical protein
MENYFFTVLVGADFTAFFAGFLAFFAFFSAFFAGAVPVALEAGSAANTTVVESANANAIIRATIFFMYFHLPSLWNMAHSIKFKTGCQAE